MKTCFKCKLSKSLDDYYKDCSRKGGVQTYCIECTIIVNKKYKHKTDYDLCECGNKKMKKSKNCHSCSGKLRRLQSEGRKIKEQRGYVYIKKDFHPYKNNQGYIFEHRLIMEAHLGRYLTKEENVHHINGIKNDNRIENLELWSVSQPKGQRVEDKVKWAEEILQKYKRIIKWTI